MQAYCFKCRRKVEIKKCGAGYSKEWETGYTRSLPRLRDQGIQNRAGLIISRFHGALHQAAVPAK